MPPKAQDEGGVKPLRLAFGAMSLVVGVQLICLIHIICGIAILMVCTSVGSIKLVGIEIPPWKQMVGASWALIGMPIIIQGGVGALYRVNTPVMNYFYYLFATCVLDLAFLLSLFYEADMCSAVMPSEYISMGPSFVCGMTDAGLFLGFLFFGIVFLYFCFVVWSCAQEISGWQPALIKKDEAPPEYDEEEYEEYLEPTAENMKGHQLFAPTQAFPDLRNMPGAPPSYPMPMKPGGIPGGGPYGSMASMGPRPSMPYQ